MSYSQEDDAKRPCAGRRSVVIRTSSAIAPSDVDRKEIESKGLGVTQTQTSWVGPWGISYGANLTPDTTGIGGWQESSFITALREGKYKGLPSGRALVPPVPWEFYKHMSNDEMKAIFAYLKSIKPVNDLVPQYQPPLTSPQGQ